MMDPLGFALENFDGVGAWRSREGNTPVDASAELVDGTPVNGPATLRNALRNRPTAFAATLTEKLLTYALGRGLTHQDMPAVRAIVRDAAKPRRAPSATEAAGTRRTSGIPAGGLTSSRAARAVTAWRWPPSSSAGR